jgi:hypothetical protein
MFSRVRVVYFVHSALLSMGVPAPIAAPCVTLVKNALMYFVFLPVSYTVGGAGTPMFGRTEQAPTCLVGFVLFILSN